LAQAILAQEPFWLKLKSFVVRCSSVLIRPQQRVVA